MPGPRSLAWLAPIAIVIALLAIRSCATESQFDRLAISPAGLAGDPPGSVVHAGWLDIARGGPVIVGFQSDGLARITVGTNNDVRGSGLQKQRFILPAGPITIRVAAHPAANVRLVWSPVGRRGDPEYLPTSSLARAPEFGSSAGAAPLDGAIALGILATIIGTLCALARARLRAIPKRVWIAMGIVFAVAMIARLWNLDGFGQAWDEDVNWAAGRNYVTNVLALDGSKRSWIWNYEHPPIMKYLVGIGAQFADGFGPARAMSALVSSLGCALLVPIGLRLYNLRAGAIAGSIAALVPTLVAHGQIVGHESPTLLWWSLGILLALGVHDGHETLSRGRLAARLVAVGAVVGVAIDSRFVNGLLGPLVSLIVVVRAPQEMRMRTIKLAAWILPLAAIATFVILWPRLWTTEPGAALGESLKKLSNVHTPEPFLGSATNRPGAHYFVTYLFATAPAGLVLLVALFGWRVVADVARRRSSIILLACFIAPLGVMFSPVRQDGVRYVIPAIAALALMGGAGFDFVLLEMPKQLHARIAMAISTIYFVQVLVRVQPYGLDYFNEIVGGAGAVEHRRWFETAWWGEGLQDALDYVNEHAERNAPVMRDCVVPGHLAWFREDMWQYVPHETKNATWIVSYAPATTPCAIPADAKLVHETVVDGAVLARVYQRSFAAR